MSDVFYAGQKDYIEKLNLLALAQDIADIPANKAAAEASALAASNSATSASSSASTAVSASNSVNAIYDNFDDRYLGAKSVAPSVDNDGATLLVGAMYFDSVIGGGSWRAWNGSIWVTAPAANAFNVVNVPSGNITASNVQLALNGLDTNSVVANSAFSQYPNRGTWVTGTAYAVKDIYVVASIAYVVTLAHTSTTVAADLAAGKVARHLGATRDELAASGGAGLVGWIRNAIGAISSSISSWIGWRDISIFEFMTPSQIADVISQAGTIDVTAAVQKAFRAVQLKRGTLQIPAGAYLLSGSGSELILIDGGLPFNIRGDGASNSSFLIDPSVPSTTDMFRIIPGTGQSMSGMSWKDFSIRPKSGSPGRDGLVFDLLNAGALDIFSRIRMEGVLIYGGSGKALRVMNREGKTESWYNNEIRNCIFKGGAHLQRIGDHNEFHGTNFNTGTPALFLSMVSIPGGTYTAHATFRNCSYTTSIGAITIADGQHVSFEHCAVEQCTPNSSGSLIKVAGVSNPANNIAFNRLRLGHALNDATKMLEFDNAVSLTVRDSTIATSGSGTGIHFGAQSAPEYATIERTAIYTSGVKVFVTSGTLGFMSDQFGAVSKFRTYDFQQINTTGKYCTQSLNAAGDTEWSNSSGLFKFAPYLKDGKIVLYNGSSNTHAAVYGADNVILNGNQIIGNRDVGWSAITGSSNKVNSYATNTITLPQLAERVAAMQAALTTHGLLGL